MIIYKLICETNLMLVLVLTRNSLSGNKLSIIIQSFSSIISSSLNILIWIKQITNYKYHSLMICKEMVNFFYLKGFWVRLYPYIFIDFKLCTDHNFWNIVLSVHDTFLTAQSVIVVSATSSFICVKNVKTLRSKSTQNCSQTYDKKQIFNWPS